MKTLKLSGLLALALLCGCGGGSSDMPMAGGAPMAGGGSGQIMITENDITDRPYRVLGDVSVSVKKSAVVDSHVQGKVINALIDKAAALHADAVINVRYNGSGGFDFGSFNLGSMDATGRAITFQGVNQSMSSASAPAPKAGEPQLPSQAEMKASLLAYINSLNAGDVAGAAAHYADDATIEDPVGTPLKNGKGEIQPFLAGVLGRKLHFEIIGTIRGSNTNVAAIPLRVTLGNVATDAIEVYTFNRDGRFSSMKAIFGSDDRVTRP